MSSLSYSPLGEDGWVLVSRVWLRAIWERKPHTLGRRGVRQLLARRKDPGRCLCLQAAHGSPALPAIPTLNPLGPFNLQGKCPRPKFVSVRRQGPGAGAGQGETLCFTTAQPRKLLLGLAQGRRGSVGKGAEAGESQASERGFESYLDLANSPCSEGEELRWGPE